MVVSLPWFAGDFIFIWSRFRYLSCVPSSLLVLSVAFAHSAELLQSIPPFFVSEQNRIFVLTLKSIALNALSDTLFFTDLVYRLLDKPRQAK